MANHEEAVSVAPALTRSDGRTRLLDIEEACFAVRCGRWVVCYTWWPLSGIWKIEASCGCSSVNRIKASLLIICGLALGLTLSACASPLYPIATGFHAALDERSEEKGTWIVWSNHPGVANAIMGMIQSTGAKVVERAKLQAILNEQEVRLTQTPDDHADILRVGKLAGATNIAFAEVTITSETFRTASIDAQYGIASARSGVRYQVSVAVRGVRVDTGEVRWSGTAHYAQPISGPDQAAVYLAQAAIARALCKIEGGYEWRQIDGCVKRE